MRARTGIILLAIWILWVVGAGIRGGHGLAATLPYVTAPLALVLGVVGGQTVHRYAASAAVRVALVVAGAGMVLGVLLVTEPGTWPLGYPNANAALAVQLVALSAITRHAAPPGHRLLPTLAIVLSVAAVALNRSAAALVVLVPVLLAVGVAAWHPPTRRRWGVVLGTAASVAAATVIVRAATQTHFPAWADRAFDPVREELWQDAAALWLAHPIAGAGPGAFAQTAPLAIDADTSTAHSSILQVGAETGWVGVVLLGALVIAGLVWATRGHAPQATLAAAAWSALAVHSTVDHLLEFESVVVAAGLVIGWAAATDSEELDVSESEGP